MDLGGLNEKKSFGYTAIQNNSLPLAPKKYLGSS